MDVRLDELEVLIHHKWVDDQLGDLGVIDPGTAVGLGVTGPNLRACGLPYDVRTAFPYAAYASIEVPVRVRSEGDTRARFLLRLAEIRDSLAIVRQAAEHLVPGPVCAVEDRELPDTLPEGTVYAAVEGPRGEWGILLVSQGQSTWHTMQLRGPSFANLSALPYLCRNAPTDHLVAILDSLDISAGEVER
jgi:NADH-quinone oxidoreductase subunit D